MAQDNTNAAESGWGSWLHVGAFFVVAAGGFISGAAVPIVIVKVVAYSAASLSTPAAGKALYELGKKSEKSVAAVGYKAGKNDGYEEGKKERAQLKADNDRLRDEAAETKKRHTREKKALIDENKKLRMKETDGVLGTLSVPSSSDEGADDKPVTARSAYAGSSALFGEPINQGESERTDIKRRHARR